MFFPKEAQRQRNYVNWVLRLPGGQKYCCKMEEAVYRRPGSTDIGLVPGIGFMVPLIPLSENHSQDAK